MFIRSGDIFTGYTKVDKQVFVDTRLSNGARVLYGYLAGLHDAQNYTDKYLIKALKISQQVLTKRKKELKDVGLIMVEQVEPRLYVLYLGNTKMSVHKTKQKWLELESRKP